MKKIERTMKEILDCKTGLTVYTDTFFENHSRDDLKILRFKLQEAYKNRNTPIYKCYECLELLRLRGGREIKEVRKYNTKLHFAHYNDTKGINCSLKTGIKQLSVLEINRRKYRGQQEGEDHIKLKNLIAQYLNTNNQQNKGVSEVIIDKNWKGENDERFNYKRPDVRCVFNSKNLVFEIQLSTTYLSVIEERQWFYKNNNAYILWVFNQFDDNDDTRRFTANDVIFSNNLNAFVLDEEAVFKSSEMNELTLKCYFRAFEIKDEESIEKWDMKWITLNELIFDEKEYKVFGVDVGKNIVERDEKIQSIKDEKKKKRDDYNRLTNYHEGLKIDIYNLILDKSRVEKRIEEVKNNQVKNAQSLLDMAQSNKQKGILINFLWKFLSKGDILPQEIKYNITILKIINDIKKEHRFSLDAINLKLEDINKNYRNNDKIINYINNLKDYNEYKIFDLSDAGQKANIKSIQFDKLKYITKHEIGVPSIFSVPLTIQSDFEKLNLMKAEGSIVFLVNLSSRLKELELVKEKLQLDLELLNQEMSKVEIEVGECFNELLEKEIKELQFKDSILKKHLNTWEKILGFIDDKINEKEEEFDPQFIDNAYPNYGE
jgi:hypothetical protein